MKKYLLLSTALLAGISMTHAAIRVETPVSAKQASAVSALPASAITTAKAVTALETSKIAYAPEVVTSPEGESKRYSRTDYSFYVGMTGVVLGPSYTRDFITDVVYSTDGNEVYIKNPLSDLVTDTYIKGSKKDNVVTVQFPQPLVTVGEETYYMNRLDFKITNEEEELGMYFIADEADNHISFTLEADGSITMEESLPFSASIDYPHMIMGLCDSQGNWVGYGDWNAVYTEMTLFPTVMPAGAQPETYIMRSNEVAGQEVNVAFVGNEVYINNLSPDYPESCIKGSVEGDKVKFPSHQYLGVDSEYHGNAYFWSFEYVWGEDPLFGEGWQMIPTDELVFDYDATNKSLKTEQAMLINLGDDDMAYLELFDAPSLWVKPTEFTLSAPEDPIIVQVQDYNPEPEYLYGRVSFLLPMFDTNDNLLDTDKMYYNVYFANQLYTFDPSIFIELKQAMTDIPYNFCDTYAYGGYDIKAYGISHIIYFADASVDMQKIGIQLVYVKDDGSLLKSNIAYYNTSGVEAVVPEAAKEVASTYYTDLTGRRLSGAPERGIAIKTTVFADGSKISSKVVF